METLAGAALQDALFGHHSQSAKEDKLSFQVPSHIGHRQSGKFRRIARGRVKTINYNIPGFARAQFADEKPIFLPPFWRAP